MARTVITVARQLASGGDLIAVGLAKALNVPIIQSQIMEAAAARAGVAPDTISDAERAPGLLERMLEYLGRYGGVDEAEMTGIERPFYEAMTRDDYRHLVEDVMRGMAQDSDAVIVAQGGSIVPRDLPYVFKVLVTAPFDLRVRRLQEHEGLGRAEAERRVTEDDKSRLDYFRTYYKVHWLNAGLYDLCINAANLDTSVAVKLIRSAHRAAVAGQLSPSAMRG